MVGQMIIDANFGAFQVIGPTRLTHYFPSPKPYAPSDYVQQRRYVVALLNHP